MTELDLPRAKKDLDHMYLEPQITKTKGAKDQHWSGYKKENDTPRSKEVSVYYGERDTSVGVLESQKLHSIGIMGRYVWPIQVYMRLTSNDGKRISDKDFANKIFDRMKLPQSADERKNIYRQLEFLCNKTGRSYPDIFLAEEIVTATLKAVGHLNNSLNPDTLRANLNGGNIKSPGEALQVIHDTVSSELKVSSSNLNSFVHPDFNTGRAVRRSLAQDIADEIINNFELADPEYKLQVVSGEKHCGKSSVLFEVYNKISDRWGRNNGSDNGFIKFIPNDARYSDLPIFAISGKNIGYKEIVEHVLLFLLGNGDAAGILKDEIPEFLKTTTIEEMLDVVAKLAKKPALYLFGVKDLYGVHGVERLVEDDGIRRLAAMLLDGSPDTRIVATTVVNRPKDKESNKFITRHKIIQTPKIHTIAALQLRDLNSFLLNDEHYRTFRQEAAQMSPQRAGGEDITTMNFNGCLLQMVATTINIANRVKPDFVEIVVKNAIEINENPATADIDVSICKALLNTIIVGQPLAVKRAIFLVLASDDGVVLTSLIEVIHEWSQNNGQNEEGTISAMKLDEILTTISEKSNGRFLQKSNMTRLNEKELFEAEIKLHERGEDNPSYTIDGPIRRRLVDYLLERGDYQREFRIASMWIGEIAGRRSFLAKQNGRLVFGLHVSELKREVQKISCVLAALDPLAFLKEVDEESGKALKDVPLLSTKMLADPITVFQHLYRTVYKRVIDYDNRLTMTLDEDKLRLEILLTFWFGVGKRFRLDSHPENDFKLDEIPSHVKAALSHNEISDFLESICSAAHYSNRPILTGQAARLLRDHMRPLRRCARAAIKTISEFERKEKTVETSASYKHAKALLSQRSAEINKATKNWIRAVCFVADNEIVGAPSVYITPNLQERDRTNKRRSYRRRLMRVRDELVDVAIANDASRLKAKRLIEHRILQFSSLLNMPPAEIGTSVDRIINILDKLNAKEGCAYDSYGGMNEFCLVESLIGESFFDEEKETPMTSSYFKRNMPIIDRVINEQEVRLSRYGGSERFIFHLSIAWRWLRLGEMGRALRLITRTRNACHSTDISFQLRATIDWTAAQIAFASFQRNPKDKSLYIELRQNLYSLYSYTKRAHLHRFVCRATLMWTALTIVTIRHGGMPEITIEEVQNSKRAPNLVIEDAGILGEPYVIAKAKKLNTDFDDLLQEFPGWRTQLENEIQHIA